MDSAIFQVIFEIIRDVEWFIITLKKRECGYFDKIMKLLNTTGEGGVKKNAAFSLQEGQGLKRRRLTSRAIYCS
jgi:hypothetical protein